MYKIRTEEGKVLAERVRLSGAIKFLKSNKANYSLTIQDEMGNYLDWENLEPKRCGYCNSARDLKPSSEYGCLVCTNCGLRQL